MNELQRVQFSRAGVNAAGDAVFDLWIDGAAVERGLTIDDVIRRIAARDEEELPARSPAAFRTPEDGRSFERRGECPKAF